MGRCSHIVIWSALFISLLATTIKETTTMPESAFVLSGRDISGDVRVTLKLANILKSRNNQIILLIRRPDVVSMMRGTWFQLRYYSKSNNWINI